MKIYELHLSRSERAAAIIAIRGYVELLRGQLTSRGREVKKCEAVIRKLTYGQEEIVEPPRKRCPECKGSGRVYAPSTYPPRSREFMYKVQCTVCKGAGKISAAEARLLLAQPTRTANNPAVK